MGLFQPNQSCSLLEQWKDKQRPFNFVSIEYEWSLLYDKLTRQLSFSERQILECRRCTVSLGNSIGVRLFTILTFYELIY